MSVSVMVATFGSEEWFHRGSVLEERLLVSQKGHEVFHYHGDSLGQARNYCAKQASGDYLIFVDADDDISDGYCDKMLETVAGEQALVQPATEYLKNGIVAKPRHLIEAKLSIFEMNWMVIGTMVKADMFEEVGGFDESLPIYEDWELWIRCVVAGAKLKQQPDAIYFINQSLNSRNNQSRDIQKRYVELIRKRYING